MIVYNLGRRWYAKKQDAETERVRLGLKPGATIKVEIRDRADLEALLTALCDPGRDTLAEANLPATDPSALIDRAFVPTDRAIPDYVPEFLLSDEERKQRRDQQFMKGSIH